MKPIVLNLRSILIGGILLSVLSVVSCSTTRHVTQLVERVSRDTIYINSLQQDSIYIYKDRFSEYHLNPSNLSNPSNSDTLFIKDVSIEYRYKFIHDTLRVVQRDTIPVEVTVTEVKEITRPLTWYDHLTRLTFWLLIGALATYIAFKLRMFFKR